MKQNKDRFIGWGLRNLASNPGWLKFFLVLAFGLAAGLAAAQPANDNFTNAIAIADYSGSVTGTNNGATLELPCEPAAILFDDLTNVDNSVWYKWTAPASGTAVFDTIGSGFDTVLVVYTTTNGLCDPSLTQIAADNYYTNALGVLQTNSQVSFTAVMGATYYVSVNGNAGATNSLGATNDAGHFVLHWGLGTIPSGALGFTLTSYTVSERDSTSPYSKDGATVEYSVLGARITVTRPATNASGRVFVDYTVTNNLILNEILRTNYYGSSIMTTFINWNTNGYYNTNGISITNTTLITVYSSNSFQAFPGGNAYYNITNATTNIVINITNYIYDINGNPDPGNPFIFNYINGQLVSSGAYPTNLPYGGLTGGVTTTISPTNIPPFNLGPTILYTLNVARTNTDNLTFTNITSTNVFVFPSVVTNVIVPADSGGITTGSGTLVFDDYQMSADILVPLNQSAGSHYAYFSGNPDSATVVLSNPRLDPLESSDLQAPTLGVNSSTFDQRVEHRFSAGNSRREF